MKLRKRAVLCMMLIAVVTMMISGNAFAAKRSIKVAGKVFEIKKGEILNLKQQVKTKPAGAAIKWKSSNKSIATVSAKGVVKGKNIGTCTITCSLKKYPSIKKKITIKVVDQKSADANTSADNSKKPEANAGSSADQNTAGPGGTGTDSVVPVNNISDMKLTAGYNGMVSKYNYKSGFAYSTYYYFTLSVGNYEGDATIKFAINSGEAKEDTIKVNKNTTYCLIFSLAYGDGNWYYNFNVTMPDGTVKSFRQSGDSRTYVGSLVSCTPESN